MSDPYKQTIMVVDDDTAIRESIAVFLRANGYEACTATDGYDALWHLTNLLVDVVVSDLEMPGLSGAEFLSVIRQRYPKMLVVAMSERPDGQSGLGSSSADGVYQKGKQHPKNLLSTVAALLHDLELEGRNREVKFPEVNIPEHRSDASGMQYLQLTSPVSSRSFAKVVPNGTDRREGGEASSAFQEVEFGYTPASSLAVVIRSTSSRECSAQYKLFYSATKLARRLLSGCRSLWSGFAGRRVHDRSSAAPGIELAHDQENPKLANYGAQNSPVFHGDGRQQSENNHP